MFLHSPDPEVQLCHPRQVDLDEVEVAISNLVWNVPHDQPWNIDYKATNVRLLFLFILYSWFNCRLRQTMMASTWRLSAKRTSSGWSLEPSIFTPICRLAASTRPRSRLLPETWEITPRFLWHYWNSLLAGAGREELWLVYITAGILQLKVLFVSERMLWTSVYLHRHVLVGRSRRRRRHSRRSGEAGPSSRLRLLLQRNSSGRLVFSSFILRYIFNLLILTKSNKIILCCFHLN